MHIIKEIYDENKNVALIIEDYDTIENTDEELVTECLNYILRKYFREPKDIYENMANKYMCEFTLRWVTYKHILCYFNSTVNALFDNKIIKLIELLGIERLNSDDIMNEFRRFRLNATNNSNTYPFVKHNILIHDLVWSKN